MLGLFILSWELTIIALCAIPSPLVISYVFAPVALWTFVVKNELNTRERDKGSSLEGVRSEPIHRTSCIVIDLDRGN